MLTINSRIQGFTISQLLKVAPNLLKKYLQTNSEVRATLEVKQLIKDPEVLSMLNARDYKPRTIHTERRESVEFTSLSNYQQTRIYGLRYGY